MERQRISDVDRAGFIAKMERLTTDKKLIDLVKEDIDQGLSITQIEDYMDRKLISYEQRKAISDMYRKGYPSSVVAYMGDAHVDVERMRAAMELYDKKVPWEDIKKLLPETNTAEELRNAFSEVLKNVQPVLAITSEDVAEEDINHDATDDKQNVPEYVEKLMSELKGLIEKINYQDGRYDAFNEILKQCMLAKKEEGVIEKLTNDKKELEAQIKELTEQLVNSQDEVAKRLKNESRLRNEVENGKEEIKKMQEMINELKEENTSIEETVKEQKQAIIAKNAIIEKKNSEKTNEESSKTENPQSIPVYYTLAVMDEHNQIHRSDVEYVKHKPSILSSLMSRFGLRKASHRNLVQMVINRELSSEQVNEIKCGLEKGLNEEQMGLIINKNLSPERIKSIVDFAALQNSLRVGRSEA